MEEYKYWDIFIKHAAKGRKTEIKNEIIKKHFGNRIPKSSEMKTYKSSAKFNRAYVKAVSTDSKLHQILSATPQDKKMAENYKKCKKSLEKEVQGNKISMKKNEFLSYLEGLDESFYNTVEEKVYDMLESRLLAALSEKEIQFRYLKRAYYDYDMEDFPYGFHRSKSVHVDPLDADNFEKFLNALAKSDNIEELFGCVNDFPVFSDVISAVASDMDEEIKERLHSGDDKIDKAMCDALLHMCHVGMMKERVTQRLLKSFSREKAKGFVLKNPHYVQLAMLEQDWLSHIPEKAKFLYPAARAMKRHFVLHVGPTNSGKTHDALVSFREAKYGVYLAPLRLLALEVFEDTLKQGVPCSMLTGEEENYLEGATHMSQTIEMASMSKMYDVAVIDEAQMIADPQRGGAWTAAILGICAKTIHVCMAPHAADIVKKLIEYCGDDWKEVMHERFTPLDMQGSTFSFPKDVKEGDALIAFSKKAVLTCAAELQGKGVKCSVIYGALPHTVRRAETEKFNSGENRVVVATDAIGMGLNLPVRRIVFLETEKFDGKEKRLLKAEEIQQIAGRAGRKGKYERGFCAAANGRNYIDRNLYMEIPPITEARLDFPESLIEFDGKLSAIMEKWLATEHESMFLKTDLTDILRLCKELERKTEDKQLIYAFCMMPFNSKDEEVMALWRQLFTEVLETGKIDGLRYDFSLRQEDLHWMNDNLKLKTLECAHQKYDLLYHCVSHFGDEDVRDSIKGTIMEEKELLSEQINRILSKQNLARRKCKECGRTLPWNYQYGYCQKCYDAMHFGRGYSWF